MTTEPEKKNESLNAIVTVIVMAGLLWYFFGGGIDKQVAKDVVDQYNIAKRNGNAMDACVHAGIVTAAYLQAKDESNYSNWKARRDMDCAKAGLR